MTTWCTLKARMYYISVSFALLSQEPQREEPIRVAPPLFYQINYTENDGPLITINLLPENYNPNPSYSVDFSLTDLDCNTEYRITIVAFNVRGAGATFVVPVFSTPLGSEFRNSNNAI